MITECRLKADIYCTLIFVISPLMLVVLTLATMRLTRLVVWDHITLKMRRTIVTGFTIGITKKHSIYWSGSGTQGKLNYLVHCVTCTGFWAAVIAVPPLVIWPTNRWLQACYYILAIAEVAPRLLNWEPRSAAGGK